MDDKKYFKAAVGVKNKLPEHSHAYFDYCLSKYSASSIYESFKDLYVFYTFITETLPSCKGMEVKDIGISVINSLEHSDIVRFQEYIAQGHTTDQEGNLKPAGDKSISRKLTILRKYYKFLCSSGLTDHNPTENVMPYTPKHNAPGNNPLADAQIQELIDAITNVKSTSYHSKLMAMLTVKRDIALVTLIFNTGLFIKACYNLNVSDVDFDNNTISVSRANGPVMLYHMNDSVRAALKDYIENERDNLLGDEKSPALFISLRKKRMNAHSIHHMIQKYGKNIGLTKKLTPTQLGSSKGNLYFDDKSGTYKV